MKIAILTDIHGNTIALEAVLEHIDAQGGVDGYWLLGDFCAIGYDPVGVLERITSLPNTRFVRGNTDRYLVDGTYPTPTIASAQANPDLVPTLVEVVQGFGWTKGMVTAASWYDWLAQLPLEQRLTLPDGTRVLLVHASPGADNNDGISPEQSQAAMEALMEGCTDDLVFVGHTHLPVDTRLNGIHVVNPASISNPRIPELQASYVMLEADETGYTVTFHRVDFDRDAVIAALRDIHYPSLDYVIGFMQGQHVAKIYRSG